MYIHSSAEVEQCANEIAAIQSIVRRVHCSPGSFATYRNGIGDTLQWTQEYENFLVAQTIQLLSMRGIGEK